MSLEDVDKIVKKQFIEWFNEGKMIADNFFRINNIILIYEIVEEGEKMIGNLKSHPSLIAKNTNNQQLH